MMFGHINRIKSEGLSSTSSAMNGDLIRTRRPHPLPDPQIILLPTGYKYAPHHEFGDM